MWRDIANVLPQVPLSTKIAISRRKNRPSRHHEIEFDWADENGDWLRNRLYCRLIWTTISCGACPRFHQTRVWFSADQRGMNVAIG
jgi:hypothetical protein